MRSLFQRSTDRQLESISSCVTGGVLQRILILAMLALPLTGFWQDISAQTTTATLSGTVVDETGALVPGAEATLVNIKNGGKRTSQSNSEGFFVFAAVPTGDYDVNVQMRGFKSNLLHDIHLDPADNKTLSKVVLRVGEISQIVNVTANDVGLINSGEKSTLITANDIKKLSVEGRDVGELVKMLPGFAIAQTSSAIDNTTYDPSQVLVTGALRSYAANGTSANGVTLLSDGSNIGDPGDYGDSVQNVNTDMVEEVKIQTSNFTAETSNGPIVVNAVGKSGTQTFHGELYSYGRTYQLNSQDALSKYEGQAKPNDRYIYPGGNVSGPILIPETDFNHARKLTFFAGAEEYAQRNVYAYNSASQAIIHALVPTAAMRAGDFSCSSLVAYLGSSAVSCNSNGTSNVLNALYNNIATVPTTAPNGDTIAPGQVGAYIDPGAAALESLIPLPNVANTGDGYNWVRTNLEDNDLYQVRIRTDYNISDKTKFFATYDLERGLTGEPETPYYSAAQTADMGGIDTPGGGLLSTINSQTAGLNLTLILSPRLTNETTANFTYLSQPFHAKRQSALDSSAIGYPYQGFSFSNGSGGYGSNGSLQYPQFHDYDYDGLPIGLFPDFSIGETYAKKFLPSAADNVTYVVKTHTLKAGVYIQQVTNNQRLPPSNSATNGQIADYYYGANYTNPNGAVVYSTGSSGGNYGANFLEGEIEQFSQQNTVPAQDLYFWNINWYITDSWKVNSRLNLDLGMRFEHLGPWQDRHGIGIAIFDPSTLSDTALPVPGFTWHGIDSSVPNSGVPGRFAFYEPRFGLNYDLFGDGKTMVRGGWGMYRNHDNWNVVQLAAGLAEGVQVTAITGGAGISLSQLSQVNAGNVVGVAGAGNAAAGYSVEAYALQKGDNEQPLTYTYSFTVDQQLPKNSQFEISYVGNQGRYLTAQNVNDLSLTLQNVNPVPYGAFFKPNPVTGAVVPLGAISAMTTTEVNQYRPYYTAATDYGDIDVVRHILYSFYNGLQTSWNKQSGHLTYGINYTWSKALGIRDGYYNGNAEDATNLRNNYGPLSFDRTDIFNASYAYDLGNLYKGSHWISGFANGWSISGITGYQSGPDLQATYYSNFNLQGKLGAPTSPTQLNVSDSTFLGTPDVELQPVLTCNPAVHTEPNQFVNGNCLRLPQIGQNGPFNYPYLRGPAFFNSDLTLVKTFTMSNKRSLQFRFAAFNFLNHPLTTFSTSFPAEIALNLSNLNPGGETQSPALATPQTGFGVSDIKEGRRVAEVAIKYNF